MQSRNPLLDGARKRASAVIYAENRLSVWARWARESLGLGYAAVTPIYKAMRRKDTEISAKEVPRSITALAKQTRSFSRVDPVPPDAVMEVDRVVARLPSDLNRIIMIDYFTDGPIEVRAKRTQWRRARYSQLLECAKYSVFAALDSRTDEDVHRQGREL